MEAVSEAELQNSLASGSKKRLRTFRRLLAKDRDNVIFDDRVLKVLKEYCYDLANLRKVRDYLSQLKDDDGVGYSQSRRQYSHLERAFSFFQEEDHPSFRWNRNYQAALKILRDEFSQLRLKRVRITCDDDIRNILPKTDTHSGWSFILTGQRYKGDYLDGATKNYFNVERTARENKSFNCPILPGTRTQGSGAFEEDGSFTHTCKHKTRLVSMIDIWQIIAECMYAVPIQRYMGSKNWYAGGSSMEQIANVIATYRSQYGRYISLDYSHYDQSISSWLIEDAFDIIKTAFVDVDEELWSIIVNDFIHKNFITKDGVIHSDKGVPSGSMFTQIIDSVVNRIMILTYFTSINARVDMIIMGDDNLMYFDRDIKVEDLCSYLTKNFGIVTNPDKSSHGMSKQHPEFLSRVWKFDGQHRNENVLIGKLLYPERFRNYDLDRTDPYVVVLSYIFAYRPSMYQLIDVERFLDEQHFRNVGWSGVEKRYLSGFLKYTLEYTSCLTHYV